MRPYIPERGDYVWIDFDPQVGHEQAGRRPALVLSRSMYNGPSRLALFCPITRKAKGFPWEVSVAGTDAITGVILADQVKSLDWERRRVEFISKSSTRLVHDVLDRIELLTS